MKKRIISLLLTAFLTTSLLPASVLAEENDSITENEVITEPEVNTDNETSSENETAPDGYVSPSNDEEDMQEPELIISETEEKESEETVVTDDEMTVFEEESTSETITLYVYDDYLDESKYVMDGKFEEFVASTANLPRSYQFPYGSSAKYSVSGNSVRVSADGIVEPKYTITYWWNNGNWSTGSSSPGDGDFDYTTKEYSYGDSTVTVTVDGKKTTYNILAVDYGEIYVEQVISDYLAQNYTAGMTDAQIIDVITRFPAMYNYSSKYTSYKRMVIYGGGDCWSSTGAIIHLAECLGYQAHSRYAANEPGAGSGHRNAAVLIGDQVYVCEAGYVGTAPRYYNYFIEPGGFYFSNGKINQYDGFESEVVIPEELNGIPVTSIGKLAFYHSNVSPTSITLPNTLVTLEDRSLESLNDITEIHIPASVTTIGNLVFSDCEKLQGIYVDPENAYFSDDNGVLYNKDKTSLLYYPTEGADSYTTGPATENIADYAFFYTTGIKQLVLTPGVRSVGEGAFGDSLLEEIYFMGDRPEIDQLAFAYLRGKIYYPADNPTWSGIENETFKQAKNVIFEGWYPPSDSKEKQNLKVSLAKSTIDAYEETSIIHNGIGKMKMKSSDETIAIVYGDGRILGTGNGTATITVQAQGDSTYDFAEASVPITVSNDSTVVASGNCPSNGTWRMMDDGTLIILGNGSMDSYGYARDYEWYPYKADIKRVIFGAGTKNVPIDAFLGYRKIKSIDIPGNIQKIEYEAFGWSDIEEVTLHRGLVSIGGYAFYNDTNLKTVYIPDTVTSIGDSAFKAIWDLDLYIPASVTEIGSDIVTNTGARIHGERGSYAETYANENNIPFIVWNPTPKLEKYQILASEDYTLRYFINIPEDEQNTESFQIRFDINGKKYAATEDGISDGLALYTLTVPVACLSDTIKAEVLWGGSWRVISEYSPIDYLHDILDRADTDPECAAARNTVEALLHYVGYAQNYFKYNTDRLANEDISDTAITSLTDSKVREQITNQITGVISNKDFAFYGSSLVCDGNLQLRLYFSNNTGLSIDEILEKYEITVAGNEKQQLIFGEKGDLIYIGIPSIKPTDWNKDFSIRIGGGEEMIHMTYSPAIYIRAAMNSDNAELKALCKALWAYNSAVK